MRANLNKLRALGILNSSAGGDVLSRPLREYDRQRGTLVKALQDHESELDDFLNQRTAEHAQAVREVETQYTDLVGRIQPDLRFNERQRSDALRSANAALQQRLAEVRQAQFNYATQVDAVKKNFATQLSQVNQYQAPNADASAIYGSGLQVSPINQGAQQGGILNDDERRRRGLLSALD